MYRPHGPRRNRSRGRGQSLVEFALLLPVMMFLLLGALDFGRVFMGWIELNNVAREAANFAADNPTAWNTVNPRAVAQAQYAHLVTSDASPIDCTLPSPIPAPSFPNGPNGQNGIAQPVSVSITCSFALITPLMSNLLGNPLPVTASAAFPIRSGMIAGIPVSTTVTTTTTTSTTTTSTSTTSTSTTSTTTTPPMCTVPNLVGQSTKFAADYWGSAGHGSTPGAGFTVSNLLFNPAVGSHNSDYTIGNQTQAAGSSLPCATTAMSVSP